MICPNPKCSYSEKRQRAQLLVGICLSNTVLVIIHKMETLINGRQTGLVAAPKLVDPKLVQHSTFLLVSLTVISGYTPRIYRNCTFLVVRFKVVATPPAVSVDTYTNHRSDL